METICVVIPSGENFITDENGAKSYKIYKNPMKYGTQKYTKNLRKDLLNGKKPKMCVRCWREEATGIKIAREGFNESTKIIEEAIASTQEDGSIPKKGVYVDLRLGNLCNLNVECVTWASNPMGRRMESQNTP